MLKRGSTFFVTGAASGIGAATMKLLADQGHRVAAADVDRKALYDQCARICEDALPIELDVRRPEQWGSALDEVWKHFGSLDVLVNNAGIAYAGLSHELQREKLRQVAEVNLIGLAYGVCAVVPRFISQGRGHVINIASLAAFVPMPGFAMYSATKHAVRAFTHAVALELRESPVRFTVVCPTVTETPMVEGLIGDDHVAATFAERSLQPQAVAAAILRAAQRQPREILLPVGRGRLLRFLGLFPSVVERFVRWAEPRGRRELARRRREAAQA